MALTGYCFFKSCNHRCSCLVRLFITLSDRVWWCFQRYRQIHFFWLKRIHCPYPTRNFWRGDPRSMDPPTDLAHRPLNRPVHGLPPRIPFTDPPYNKKGQLRIWQRTIYRPVRTIPGLRVSLWFLLFKRAPRFLENFLYSILSRVYNH